MHAKSKKSLYTIWYVSSVLPCVLVIEYINIMDVLNLNPMRKLLLTKNNFEWRHSALEDIL